MRVRLTHGGLLHFVRHFWSVLEPAQPMVEGRVLNVIAMHLEAVTRGEIRRLLINVSLGSMKSLLVNVFWPLWTWPPPAWRTLRHDSFRGNKRPAASP